MRKYSEFRLIERIRKLFPAAGSVTGIGDDTAVIENGRKGKMLVTTDTLVEGIHFLPGIADFSDIGYKSIAVNMSDIAAMGGVPEYALLTLGIPDKISDRELEMLFEGMKSMGREQPYRLIGGDTVKSPCLFITVTMIGYTDSAPLLRSTASEGEYIYVTGNLGDSSIGLGLLNGDLKYGVTDAEYFIKRHNRPPSRVGLMQGLKGKYAIGSAVDISDGLLADLAHIADESGKGFRIHIDKLPVSSRSIGPAFEVDRKYFYEFAWSGGEDYELLFTSRDNIDLAGISRIGEVTGSGREVFYLGEKLPWGKLKKGFEHF
jgi:thiamine-monophosphate kinase